jgi:hypothetical protein
VIVIDDAGLLEGKIPRARPVDGERICGSSVLMEATVEFI